jgi:hypothetical protein
MWWSLIRELACSCATLTAILDSDDSVLIHISSFFKPVSSLAFLLIARSIQARLHIESYSVAVPVLLLFVDVDGSCIAAGRPVDRSAMVPTPFARLDGRTRYHRKVDTTAQQAVGRLRGRCN